jgi:hypothetical protein
LTTAPWTKMMVAGVDAGGLHFEFSQAAGM